MSRLLGIGSATISLMAYSIAIWGFWRGIDLTDEGYYLNFISSPFHYKSSYSQFGFLLHPLYKLVGGDLISLRISGLFLLTVASSVFISTLLRLPLVKPALSRTDRLLVTISGSSGVLLSYFPWVPTPGYNLLNLAGVLIIFSGWLEIASDRCENLLKRWRRPVAIVVCALGFATSALVKPTTAAALAMVIPLLTLAFGRRAFMDVIVAGTLSFVLVVLLLFAIDGDVHSSVMRYQAALQDNNISNSGHDLGGLIKIPDLSLGYRGWGTLLLMAVLGAALSTAFSTRHLAVQLSAGVAVLALQLLLFRPLITSNGSLTHWSLAVMVFTGITTRYLIARNTPPIVGVNRRHGAIFLGLVFAPITVALGTNTDVWQAAARAGIFWTAAIVLFVIWTRRGNAGRPWLHYTMVAASLIVIQTLVYAVEMPYRIIGPLREQTEWISSATTARFVKVDPVTATYFRSLLSGARAAGFEVGTPIIDLTGIGPTTEYVLGGEPTGLAWFSGGYSGSRNLALHALLKVPKSTLQQSWILTSPRGKEALPSEILDALGLKFPEEYNEVARGRTGFMDEEHILWKPRSGT